MNVKQAYQQFLCKLDVSFASDMPSYVYLQKLVEAFRTIEHFFPTDVLEDYSLPLLMMQDFQLLPTEFAQTTVEEEHAALHRVRPGSPSGFAQSIRSLIEGLTLVESVVDCPACGGVLVILYDDAGFVLSCNQCGWAQRLDGAKASDNLYLIAPTREVIMPVA